MKRYFFEFTASPIVITSKKPIGTKTLDYIDKFILSTKEDLNHNIYNSTSFLFNRLKKDSIISLNAGFIFYLKQNLSLVEKFPSTVSHIFSEIINPSTDLEIFKENKLMKLKDFELNTFATRSAFIVDTIYENLLSRDYTNFIINHDTSFRSSGKDIWKTFIEIEHNKKVFINLVNASVSKYLVEDIKKKPEKNFLSTDKKVDFVAFILEGEYSLIHLTGLKFLISELLMESEINMFAKKYNLKITLLDKEENIVIF